jgi:RNA polymerase sigma-70 factor, ECF subfamily
MAEITTTDQDLLALIRDRDAEAFETLLERYRALVRRHLLGIVHNADVTDDLLQEVFLRVWTHGQQWDGRGPFRAWLLRVATNLALNQLRSASRRREHAFDPQPELDHEDEHTIPGWMIDASASRPDLELEIAERRRLLRRMIDDLPDEKREVVHMALEAEMEIREVAQRLGIPEGTVKSRLYYARQRLAREWKEIETEWEE